MLTIVSSFVEQAVLECFSPLQVAAITNSTRDLESTKPLSANAEISSSGMLVFQREDGEGLPMAVPLVAQQEAAGAEKRDEQVFHFPPSLGLW